jgi:hypothetical protein
MIRGILLESSLIKNILLRLKADTFMYTLHDIFFLISSYEIIPAGQMLGPQNQLIFLRFK